jgi:hypothetical protein
MVFKLYSIVETNESCDLIDEFNKKNIPYSQILISDVSHEIVETNMKIMIGKGYYIFNNLKYLIRNKHDNKIELTISLDAFNFLHSLLVIYSATDSRSSHTIFNSMSRYLNHIFKQPIYTYTVIFAFSRLIHKDRRRHRGIPDINSIYMNIHRKLNSILELITEINETNLDALHTFINMKDGHIVQEGIENILPLLVNSQYYPFLSQLKPGLNLNDLKYPVIKRGDLDGHIIFYTILTGECFLLYNVIY